LHSTLGLALSPSHLPQWALAVQAKATRAINATIFFIDDPFLVCFGWLAVISRRNA
jgi:hypothetical protein